MIERARAQAVAGRFDFEFGDARRWRRCEPVDCMLLNACFKWIDDHRELFDHLLPQLADDGVLAFQVPTKHTEPSHTILRDLCSSPRWQDQLEGLPRTGGHEPQWYLDELGSRGLDVNAWQTTYFHSLEVEDPVLEWVRGTTLRPIFERIPEEEDQEFLDDYGALLRGAYSSRNGKTVFPFKRTFVVATNPR